MYIYTEYGYTGINNTFLHRQLNKVTDKNYVYLLQTFKRKTVRTNLVVQVQHKTPVSLCLFRTILFYTVVTSF